MDKLLQARKFIARMIEMHRNPAIMCSFGKDSMIMTYLALEVKRDLPVILFRNAYKSLRKYRYADQMIQWFGDKFDMNFIQGLPPAAVELFDGNGNVDFMERYTIGSRTIGLPVGVVPDEGGICSKDRIYNQIKGNYQWNYDLLFLGHKACDTSNLMVSGKVPISIDLLQIQGSSSLAYPLKDWSDSDVFEAFKELEIPMDDERYEEIYGVWGERQDKMASSDWTPACINCMNVHGEKNVYCPKLKAIVNNLGKELTIPNPLETLEYMK